MNLDERNALYQQLRKLGYDARRVNGDCFDIHQDGYIHYLSSDEARELAKAGAGLNLLDHSEKRGLNRWYTFPANGARL